MQPLVIEALILKSPDDLVRVIVGKHCLDFPPADVLDLHELPAPSGLIPGRAVYARLTLRSGATLMRIASAQDYEPLLWAWRRPFPYATRPERSVDGDAHMAEQEQAYFRERGITAEMLGVAIPTPQAGASA
ncbi:MAG: hypothetical protein KGN16_22655 [Burkholderiales bacterium]|nr:hypothetical protein [Burkholderiales bacterium]